MTAPATTTVRPRREAPVNMPSKARRQRAALTISPTINMPSNARRQRKALTISPTVNMPKGMLRIK